MICQETNSPWNTALPGVLLLVIVVPENNLPLSPNKMLHRSPFLCSRVDLGDPKGIQIKESDTIRYVLPLL